MVPFGIYKWGDKSILQV